MEYLDAQMEYLDGLVVTITAHWIMAYCARNRQKMYYDPDDPAQAQEPSICSHLLNNVDAL